MEPLTLLTGQNKVWTNKGSLKDVPSGWYWVVFCISFDTLELGQLNTTLFDARRGNAWHEFARDEHTYEALLTTDEIRGSMKQSATEGLMRYGLHRQVNIMGSEEYLYFTVNADAQLAPQSFKLHYVELGTCHFPSKDSHKDCILYGIGSPHQLIAVDQDLEREEKSTATKICAYGISDTADFAVTLHMKDFRTAAPNNRGTSLSDPARVRAVVSVWDLRSPVDSSNEDARGQLSWEILKYSKPCAETVFDPPERPLNLTLKDWEKFPASISISTNGSRVALSSCSSTLEYLPFVSFDCKLAAPIDNVSSSHTHTLTTRHTFSKLKNFVGFGTFHRVDPNISNIADDNDNDNERFIAFTGSVLEVYSTSTLGWIRRQQIKLPQLPDFLREHSYEIIQSLRGRRLAWTGMHGVLSIWDIEKAKMLSYIFVDMDESDVRAVLSPDGSKVAISGNRSIQIYDTSTGILLGTHTKGDASDNQPEMVLGNEYFVVRDNLIPHESAKVWSAVRIKNMEVMSSETLHEDYHIANALSSTTTIAAYKQGSALKIRTLTGMESPEMGGNCGNTRCKLENVAIDQFTNGTTATYISGAGEIFLAKCSQQGQNESRTTLLTITVISSNGCPDSHIVIDLRNTSTIFQGFYLSGSSTLVILVGGYVKTWKLSTTAAYVCQLANVWGTGTHDVKHATRISSSRYLVGARSCPHGTSMELHLRRPGQVGNNIAANSNHNSSDHDIFTAPPNPAVDTFETTAEKRFEYGIHSLIEEYRNGDLDRKNDITRYFSRCIRPSILNPVSCLVPLCKAWSPKNRGLLLELVGALLPSTHITWIPDPKAAKSTDPLAALISLAKDKRSVIVLVRVLVEYCFAHTTRSKNLTFLSPLFASMPGIMEYYSEDAHEYIGRIAYIPTKHPTFIWKNHVRCQKIAPFRSPLWNCIRRIWTSRSDIRRRENSNAIMQLKLKTDSDGDNEENLEKPVFMATFDALWFYRNKNKDTRKQVQGRDAYGKGDGRGEMEGMTEKEGASERGSVHGLRRLSRRMSSMVFVEDSARDMTIWWKARSQSALSKVRFYFHPAVECHDFSLDFLDNPAIAALVNFKWETIGFMYWFLRFFYQCIYYILIIIAVLAQVYLPEPSNLYGVFIVIIIIGLAFVFFEIMQAISNSRRYIITHYHLMDAFAFIVPPVASVMQLYYIHIQDTTGNNRTLSFSILIIFIHMVFELRISKSVCKYVTIIYRAVCEAFVFLVIGAAGLMAFNITILHMLRSCSYEGCTREETRYPSDFLGGLSTTAFFLSGRFDAVSDELDANVAKDWAFQLAMFGFVLAGSILMMNVLIALINVAFTKGDDGWRLMWIQSRLRYIESAENLSYRIPGFRLNYDWFPKQIYFTATDEDRKAYLRKYPSSRRDNPLLIKTANTHEEDCKDGHDTLMVQMEGVLRQAQEFQVQARESQRQAQESQRQMNALIDRMVQSKSSIPASALSSL
ncbi:hypothetical protein BGZ95_002985 [Linnemannia exigua]|uniref:Ion transport domain-containing protein n=1 Tax=Linnemannia exigua TaxID=604196 RepID=A0AAD4D6X8_9FUNG|nr:hypothetical protein BGZ95_002985 [Linnemannia exigua]